MKNVKEVSTNRQLAKNHFNTILFIILLVAISLLLGLLPMLSFGQDSFLATPPASASDIPLSFSPNVSSPTPTAPTSITLPTNTDSTPNTPSGDLNFSAPITSNNSELVSSNNSSTSPLPPAPPQRSPKTPKPKNIPLSGSYNQDQKTSTQFLSNHSEHFRSEHLRSEDLRSVADPKHPFARYFELPKESQSIIKGQPYTIAQLLDGTKTSSSRRQLLQTYWELTGLLAEYNIRCEAERLSGSVQDAQQNLATVLLQQQRRSVEMEFVKKQWQLTGLLRHFKGISLSEKELPIPCDYPLFKRYETFSDKIARTARSQYLGHLIPVQEQLIDARHRSCTIIFEMLQNIPMDSRQLVDVLNQRTTAFLELIEAVIDYNKMIAEYTSETIPLEVSGSRLVGALIELPKTNSPTPNLPTSHLQTPNPPISNQSTEYTEPETLRLSGTPQMNPQSEIPRPNLVPQRLPVGNVPFPPIEPAIIQTSYTEEQ
jgi:hypothetical protein